MSPELSRETRIKLCALTMMLSSYQVREVLGWGGHLLPQNWELGRFGCLGFLQVLEGSSGRRKMFLVKVGRWVVLTVERWASRTAGGPQDHKTLQVCRKRARS